MKHLLRKLHIGGSVNEQQHRLNSSPAPVPLPSSSSSSASSSSSSSSSSSTSTFPRTRGIDAVDRITEGGGVHTDTSVDYNFFEEEFQVQLALAISASDPEGTEDRESAQIKAAEQLSLCCPSSSDTSETLAEDIALRYWNYNVVDYHEKIMDGFYDVYGVTSDSLMQGRMPLLVDLQATSILDNVGYEVILVNRTVDPALQQLERRADSLLQECPPELGPILSGLIQKIADLVVASMGGPVGDAVEMSKRWKVKSDELRSSLNAIILPLGCLNVGLSRHRALLFKVLADRINLPCRLVKGSYYTGTDEGAVNLIKIDYDGEYIIDLMGAPGVLIPAEIPSNHFQNFGVDLRGSLNIAQTVKHSSLAFGKVNRESDKKIGMLEGSLLDSDVAQKDGSGSNEASYVGIQPKGNDVNLVPRNQTERFEDDFGKLLPSLRRSPEGTLGSIGKNSPAQKLQVKDVSKCVISAAQNPDFAQKLHALLLESSALPPDLLVDLDPSQDLGEHSEQNALVQSYSMNGEKVDVEAGQRDINFPQLPGFGMSGLHFAGGTNVIRQVIRRTSSEKHTFESAIMLTATETDCLQEYKQRSVGSKEMETISNNPKLVRNAHNEWLNSMLDEVADWEIPWCDIQIGERIGIGSYGEVYHADWNGTEVAVKKFFDQDFSGDALEQLKCEVKIMLRLRHPNVVLFMGAVTRPPNLSILTEFLPRGSLCKLLHRPNVQLDEKRRLRMALDVAKGMNYLHTSNPTIVHRDLKSPNLLVDKNWVVKVCDFGLSRLKHHTFLSSKSMAGTPEWMAPEVLRNEPSNEKCDVYSFGVILWELATLQLPWSGMNPMQVVGAVGFQNRRLEIPEEVDPMVAQIMRDCWHSDPDLRPSFSQLMSLLKRSKHLIVEKT